MLKQKFWQINTYFHIPNPEVCTHTHTFTFVSRDSIQVTQSPSLRMLLSIFFRTDTRKCMSINRAGVRRLNDIGISWRHAGQSAITEYNNQPSSPGNSCPQKDVNLGKHGSRVVSCQAAFSSQAHHMPW